MIDTLFPKHLERKCTSESEQNWNSLFHVPMILLKPSEHSRK